jgi:cellulose synthase operon protein C
MAVRVSTLKLWRWIYFCVFVLFCGLFYQWFFSGETNSDAQTPEEFGFESVVQTGTSTVNPDESNLRIVDELVDQMQLADALDRRELLVSALDRLLLLDPNKPAAAFFKAYMAIENGDAIGADAILLAQENSAPDALTTRQLASYIKAMTSQRNTLQQARIFRRAARYDEALLIYKKLFPDGMPTLKLELEYLDVLSHIKGNDAFVLHRLLEINRQYPDVALLELTLADFRSQRNPHDPVALAIYRRLAQGDGFGRRAADSWIRALGRLPNTASVLDDYALLAQRYPGDLDIQNAYRNVLNELAAEQERLKDPYYRAKKQGLALLDVNRLNEAEKQLRYSLRGRPEDADVLGGLGILYLRRGDHDSAILYFNKAAQYNQDPDMASKWAGLIETSRYWSALRRGESLTKKGRFDEADAQLKRARELDPSNAATFIAMAELARARGKPLTADVFYLEALRRDPNSRSALLGRVNVRERLSGRRAALALADAEYSGAQRQRIAAELNTLRVDEQMDMLKRLDPQQGRDSYIAAINSAIELNPVSPWQRADIATALLNVGEEIRADNYMADSSAQDKSPEMAFAYGLYLSARGDSARAITVMTAIPEAKRSEAMQKNVMRLQLDNELAAIKRPDADDRAVQRDQLDKMAQQYVGQPRALLRLAEICLDLDERERAIGIANGLSPDDTWTMQSRLDFGRLLLKLNQFDRFSQGQQRWASGQYSPAEQAQLDELALEYDLARAQYYAERGDTIIAYSMYQRAAENPGAGQLAARISLLKITAQLNNKAELSKQSDVLLEDNSQLNPSQILDIVRVLQGEELIEERKRFMQVFANRKDASAQQLREAMLIEKERRDWDASESFAYSALEKARIEEGYSADGPVPSKKTLYQTADENYWLTSSVKSTISELRERRDGYIKFGLDHSFRSGKDTTSQLPIEVRWPVPSLDGHLLFRVDYVTVKSGTVDYLDPDALPPTTITRVPFAESARGIAVGVGWEAEKWHADIGTTPIGFRESSLVGGVGIKGDVGEFGWNAVLSQRPEVSTTLSYAGMEVPNGAQSAGAEWGGVISSGAKLGLSYDLGGANGYWASLQYHQMTGERVADNTRFGFLGGVYHRLIDDEDRKFRVGLNVLHFQYDKNLSEVTLQHGSYFSPQNYVSVSLPVRYFGRHGPKWSYLLAASVSNSWSTEDAPYLLGSGSTSGGGFGYALEAALEKRVSKRWYVGLAADIQRADFYEPNHVVIYAKYTFTDRWQPIWTPPEPPIPYGEFD